MAERGAGAKSVCRLGFTGLQRLLLKSVLLCSVFIVVVQGHKDYAGNCRSLVYAAEKLHFLAKQYLCDSVCRRQ